ncbi:polysaccharide pyruvyl transferase family protein, partial [bacterium]|nr:polysaccharide pyruvyl transferase family protein [bacterium]
MNFLLVGFFGEGNLGDEAILSGITKFIFPPNLLYVTSGTLKKTSDSLLIKRRGVFSWPEYLKTLKAVDRVFFSGGILQDWSLDGVTFFALRLIAARFFKKKPALWGAGIGPLRFGFTLGIAKRSLESVGVAWLRDVSSARLFTALTRKNANLGTDWSWALEPSINNMSSPRSYIGLNLRPWVEDCW